MINEKGHTMLARLGKKRLRPGGVSATNWLIDKAEFKRGDQVLEIACNRCDNAIKLVQRYDIEIVGVDMDQDALAIANKNILEAGLEERIKAVHADATSLPVFEHAFDVTIVEALFTMLSRSDREKVLSNVHQALKKGGKILTHDIVLLNEKTRQEIRKNMTSAVQGNVDPLSEKEWKDLIINSGFTVMDVKITRMSLLTPRGLVRDEGFFNAVKILMRGLQPKNRKHFIKMFKTMRKYRHELNAITIVAVK